MSKIVESKGDRLNDDDVEIEKLQFKVILLGDGAVGKSSITMRFAEDQFKPVYKQTVGCDFFVKRLDIPPKYQVTLQIWDIGGQSIKSKMISKYISGAHAILLCYDITSYESFSNLEDWYRIVITTFRDHKLPYVVLVGNKNDLRHMSAVRIEQHNAFADENEMASFLISAKNGDQVKQAFWKIAATLSGVPTMKPQYEIATYVIPATIIDHKRHDDSIADGKVPEFDKNKNCIIS